MTLLRTDCYNADLSNVAVGKSMPKILLIDDDADFSSRLRRGLAPHYQVTCLEEADAAALERLAAGEFALVLLDNGLPKISGIEFLEKLEAKEVTVPVILVSHAGDPQLIIAAKKRGAFAYVQKQETDELVKELKPLIAEALEIWPQETPVVLPPLSGTAEVLPGPQLVGNCRAMRQVYEQIGQVAKIAQPVLIFGAAGTGKDLVARAIHDHGPRQHKPFVVVRCNTFADDLLRDELFGHEIGFRGEGKLRKGKFEYADGGTLFLDEVGELPRALQDEVLRVLEEQQVTRLGGNESIPIDVRVLAASRRDLLAIPESKFRRELLAQLTSETIRLPPLAERRDDLEVLARHILAKEAGRARVSRVPALDGACQAKLRGHSWPGNVRELQMVLRRALLHCCGRRILPRDITFEEPSAEPQIVAGLQLAISAALGSGKSHLFGLLLDLLKKELITRTLQECEDDTSEAEKRLGVSLRDIFPGSEPAATPAEASLPEEVVRRIKALVLIQTYPEWSAKQFAEKLKCSTATLYRDPLINRALELRKGDRRLPHGHKSRDGAVEAYED
jgi:two-component system C4-dicarboxylate transport response regulator DctD